MGRSFFSFTSKPPHTLTKSLRTSFGFTNKRRSHTTHRISPLKTLTKHTNKKSFNNKKTKKHHKWSAKYKHSINCLTPRGFSQKQYCKYGKKS